MTTTTERTFTIFSRTTLKPFLTTDDENLAMQSVGLGHKVTRTIFGEAFPYEGRSIAERAQAMLRRAQEEEADKARQDAIVDAAMALSAAANDEGATDVLVLAESVVDALMAAGWEAPPAR